MFTEIGLCTKLRDNSKLIGLNKSTFSDGSAEFCVCGLVLAS